MMVQSEVLKPCPFCGTAPERLKNLDFSDGAAFWHPEADCILSGCSIHRDKWQGWNTRTAAVAPDEGVARLFHETYERLAPQFSYETRKASAVPWEQVPENNRNLMIAVAAEVRAAISAMAPNIPPQ